MYSMYHHYVVVAVSGARVIHHLLLSPRSQGHRSEVSRRDDDGLHPDLMPILSHITEGEEELCATAAAAAVTSSREEVAVYIRRADQDPGAAGGDTHPQ